MSEATWSVMVVAALKGGVLLVLATAFTFLLRRASAGRRHLVWSAAVTALLLIPLLSFVLPAWGILPTISTGTQVPFTVDFDAPPNNAVESGAPISAGDPMQTAAETWTQAPAPAGPQFSRTQLLVWAWLLGTALVLLSIVIGFLRVFWLARRSVPLSAGHVYQEARALCDEHGVRVQLLQGDQNAMPMIWGVFHPTVLLPRAAAEWSAARLRAVLRHELAHVRRRDALWQLIAELACAWHWFNPLVWYAAHRMRVEREHACDDAVLVAGSRASEYASELLEIARSMRAARATSMAAIAMARPRRLEARLLAVLDEERNRSEAARRWPTWLAAATVALPLAAVAPAVEQAVAFPTEDVGHAPIETPRKVAPQATQQPMSMKAAIVSAGILDHNPDCLKGDIRQMSTSISADDDRAHTLVKWETRDCKGTLEIEGEAKIAGDLSGFQSITPGGRIRIETRDRESRRKLTLTPSNGRFSYTYEVDGERRAWDKDGQSWLASVLTLLVRRGGYGAEERVDYLLREKGVAGVLDEVALMSSDHAQRRYLTLMLNKTMLKPRDVQDVLEVAGRELESDHELAQTLTAVTKTYGFTAESRSAYMKAVRSLGSDHERSRALLALLDKGRLTEDGQVAVLEMAAEIRSRHERGRVLRQLMNNADFKQARFQEAYLKSANVHSDHEVRQMLSSLLRRGRLVPSAVDLALTLVGTIHSDHERAQVLTQLINTQTFTAAQSARLLELTEEIGSEHERGRVASLLIRKLKN